nr:hypothetical protein 27 [bacterium]
MDNFTNFNDAAPQHELIPAGEIVKVKFTIRPGGYESGGWLTQGKETDSVYISGVCTVLEGKYLRRKIFTKIGIKGSKVDENGNNVWGNMGRSTIRAMLEAAKNIKPKDQSPDAQADRCISSIAQLDGLEFPIKVGIEDDSDRNKILSIITPDRKEYAEAMGSKPSSSPQPHTQPTQQTKPAWVG